MKKKLLKIYLFGVFICVVPFSSAFSNNDSSPKALGNAQTTKYKNYDLNLQKGEDAVVYYTFTISKDNKEEFKDESITALKSGDDLKSIHNINDIKSEILIVESYSGGAHGIYYTTILKLGDNFSVLAKIDGRYSPVHVEKLAGEQNFIIKVSDWNYAYHWTCFAASYAPEVILNLKSGKKSVALEEMRKKELTQMELQNIINNIKAFDHSKFRYVLRDDEINLSQQELQVIDDYFSKLFEPVLDLIYSGRAAQVKKIIDSTWLGSASAKKQFLEDFKEVIKKSEYYNELLILNESLLELF